MLLSLNPNIDLENEAGVMKPKWEEATESQPPTADVKRGWLGNSLSI